VVVGLTVRREGLPKTHHVYPAAMVDVTTFAPMTEELR